MHDIAALEGLGLPGVFVASTAFIAAAKAQARALDADVRFVTVPHPIQNRTDAEMHALADDVIDGLTAALAGG